MKGYCERAPELCDTPVRIIAGTHRDAFKEANPMPKKPVPVTPHRRSKPSSPAHPGPGKKPGPKTVPVVPHRRSRPG